MFADICNPLTVDIDDNPDSCWSDVYTRLANYSATNTNQLFGVKKTSSVFNGYVTANYILTTLTNFASLANFFSSKFNQLSCQTWTTNP